MAELKRVRLLGEFRGHQAGDVVLVSPELARILQADGRAEAYSGGQPGAPERAVAISMGEGRAEE